MASSRTVNPGTLDQTKLSNNLVQQSWSKTLEYMNANVIFAHYLIRGFRALNMGYSRYVFFPLAILGSLLDVTLVIKQARLEKKIQGYVKGNTIAKLLVESIVFGATGAALIGGSLAPVLFAVIAPALLVGGIGLKALWDFGNAAMNLAKSFKASDNALDDEEIRAAKRSAVRGVISGLVNSAIAVSLALLSFGAVPFVFMLALGVGGTVVGVALNAYEIKANAKVTVVSEPADAHDQALLSSDAHTPVLSSTASFSRRLNIEYGVDRNRVLPKTSISSYSSGPAQQLSSSASSFHAPYPKQAALDREYEEEFLHMQQRVS